MKNKLILYKKILKKIFLSKKVFEPNLTTELSFLTANKYIKNSNKILDLGCGSGIIGISVFKSKKNIQLCMSDVDKSAYNLAFKNLKHFNIVANIKCGSLYSIWKKDKFDYIINDVSGISEKVANISPWFKNIPCKSGNDGTKLTIKILKESSKKLKKNGLLQIPILSLSNSTKILKFAKKKFSKVTLATQQKWVLPKSMSRHINFLFELKKKRLIDFDYQFNRIICQTSIVVCKK
jgi:ribosomal protein L11 methylase PrmA